MKERKNALLQLATKSTAKNKKKENWKLASFPHFGTVKTKSVNLFKNLSKYRFFVIEQNKKFYKISNDVSMHLKVFLGFK